MTESNRNIGDRIAGIRQIGAVVNAMRGIAGARAQRARSHLLAVDSYAAMIATAIGRAMALSPHTDGDSSSGGQGRLGLILFCAEQGFAGAFSERVLDSIGNDWRESEVFLLGTRGVSIAAERGIVAGWHGAVPSNTPAIPRLADRLAGEIYSRIAAGRLARLDAVFSQWQPGHGISVHRRRLLPLDESEIPPAGRDMPPLHNLEPALLVTELASAYLHAQLCNAALHAFAAENEARMAAMAEARGQIEDQLTVLEARQRRVRQEEITSEIIELVAGETAGRSSRQR